MSKNVLITGGAGFIGSHLADELLKHGYHVRAFDNLSKQVHGKFAVRPSYLNQDVELLVGDVRDRAAVKKALKSADIVFHFAAMVGVGQSMYQIQEYTEVNNLGTAVLISEIIDQQVEKLVVASSMSVYGEGLYHDADKNEYMPSERKIEDLKASNWDIKDESGRDLFAAATHEEKPPSLTSIYALNKYDQERMCMLAGRAYNIPVCALRFFNVFGSRQALSNPYTGVLAIFASRILNDLPPVIYEDGKQIRDFVHVRDVARACRLAIENPYAEGEVFNVGSGKGHTILEVANKLAKVMGKPSIQPQITGKYRMGDIRHCYADLNKAKNKLGYEPMENFEKALAQLAIWLEGQIAVDKVDEARKELSSRGLTI
jgi:dTDP-L-rhamnose 4-epimerase